ncbi:unnamed protein product [Leuciscus chuanchicus]
MEKNSISNWDVTSTRVRKLPARLKESLVSCSLGKSTAIKDNADLNKLWIDILDRQITELNSRFQEDQCGLMRAAAACLPGSDFFSKGELLRMPCEHYGISFEEAELSIFFQLMCRKIDDGHSFSSLMEELFKNTELMELWPALKMESEVYAEFQRITNQNLHNTFYSELDRHLPRLMTLFRQKAGRTGKKSDALTEILKIHDAQEFHDIHTKRVTVLHALPVYLREDVSEFFKTCIDTSDEPELLDVSVALLTVVKDNDTSPVHFQPVKICCH